MRACAGRWAPAQARDDRATARHEDFSELNSGVVADAVQRRTGDGPSASSCVIKRAIWLTYRRRRGRWKVDEQRFRLWSQSRHQFTKAPGRPTGPRPQVIVILHSNGSM